MRKTIQYLGSILLLAATVVFASGCSDQTTSEIKEEQYSVISSDVAEINISVKDRAIEIVPSSNGEIRITYSENEKEFYEINLDEKKVLTMQSASDKELSDFFGLSSDSMRAIKLELPNPLPCNLVISTTKNEIQLPEMVIEGKLDIQINDGAIILDRVSSQGEITLNSKNGDISGTLLGTYEDFRIQSNAHKGKNNLPENKADGTKGLNVNTNNGNIDLAFA